MRYLIIPAIILLSAVQAQAAFDPQVREGFMSGCNKNAKGDAATQTLIKNGCQCMYSKLEASMTQDQFIKLPSTPDGGKSVITPIAQSCMKQPAAK